jgi:geranylgeranyl diphosphate synthase type II
MADPRSEPDVERELSAALERRLRGRDGIAPPRLRESMSYSLLAPGKRIRPRLTLASGEALGLSSAATLPAALAIEMVHCFTLIHDDLPCMDDDDLRRGLPSNHRQFDEATALLAGDGLIAAAVETLLETSAHVAPERVLRALARLAWAMGPRGVVGGQAAETALSARSSLEDLRHMHAGKTGALFSAAVLMPLDLVGLEPFSARTKALERFAAQLGLAFQAVDDLEDADQDAQPGGVGHGNVLHYLTASQVRESSTRELRLSAQNLEVAFGASSTALISIADEVLARLKQPS